MKISNELSLEEIIEYLKKDNKKNANSMKRDGYVSWDIDKVKNLVDTYLDSVLRFSKEEIKLK